MTFESLTIALVRTKIVVSYLFVLPSSTLRATTASFGKPRRTALYARSGGGDGGGGGAAWLLLLVAAAEVAAASIFSKRATALHGDAEVGRMGGACSGGRRGSAGGHPPPAGGG